MLGARRREVGKREFRCCMDHAACKQSRAQHFANLTVTVAAKIGKAAFPFRAGSSVGTGHTEFPPCFTPFDHLQVTVADAYIPSADWESSSRFVFLVNYIATVYSLTLLSLPAASVVQQAL